jgi:hypothetical protein
MIKIEQITPEQFFDYYFIVESPLDSLKFESEHRPFEYLEFARKDLETGEDTRNTINAVGNAKRALHLQVETICNGYGYKAKCKDFPPKLTFLRDIGIVAPKVLEKLNKIRNRIEHDYYCPTLDEANDFIDVVELFLYATLSLITAFPSEGTFALGAASNECWMHEEIALPGHVKVYLEKNTGKFTVRNHDKGDELFFSVCNHYEDDKLFFSVQMGQEKYFEWVRKLFAHIFFLPI